MSRSRSSAAVDVEGELALRIVGVPCNFDIRVE
jgi:hypothetical protein